MGGWVRCEISIADKFCLIDFIEFWTVSKVSSFYGFQKMATSIDWHEALTSRDEKIASLFQNDKMADVHFQFKHENKDDV